MTAAEADRLIVEFARLVGAQRVLVVGSQALHAYYVDPSIDTVVESREIDVIPLPYEAFDKWYFYAHEQLGADSEFDERHGVYVDMLRERTAKLPRGWENRVLERRLELESGSPVTAVYPDIHDLLVSKLLANRPQDEAFLRGVRSLITIDRKTLEERLGSVELPKEKERLRTWATSAIARIFSRSGAP